MKTAKPVRDMEVLKTARWVSLNEAAAFCNVSIKTVLRWIDAGNIIASKRGEWFVDRESIDSYLAPAAAPKINLRRAS